MSKLGEDDSGLMRAEIEGLRRRVAKPGELRAEDRPSPLRTAPWRGDAGGGPESAAAGAHPRALVVFPLSLARYQEAKVAAQNAHRILEGTLGEDHPNRSGPGGPEPGAERGCARTRRP